MDDTHSDPEVRPDRGTFPAWLAQLGTGILFLVGGLAATDALHYVGNSILLEPEGAVAFKRTDSASLVGYFYLPANWHPETSSSAVIFFQEADSRHILFDGYSRYLAMRGAVAVVVQYRTEASHEATPQDSVADGRDAIRWVRAHADRIGIDPNRIAVGGAGPDGYLAAVTALSGASDHETETPAVESAPNALLLYSTVLTIPSGRWQDTAEWKSPLAMVTEASPPTFIFHTTSGAGWHVAIRRFCSDMRALGNICEATEDDLRYENYWLFRLREHTSYFGALRDTDRFLVSLGFLEGDPRVRASDTQLLDRWETLGFLVDRFAPWGPERRRLSTWERLSRDVFDPAGRG